MSETKFTPGPWTIGEWCRPQLLDSAVGIASLAIEQVDELGYSTSGVAVPAGWRLVPVEPTEAMKKAGYDAFMAAHDPFYNKNEPSGPIYKSMLSAAPEPPTALALARLVEEAVKVLEPFADAMNYYADKLGDEFRVGRGVTPIYLGHLRAARDLHSKLIALRDVKVR